MNGSLYVRGQLFSNGVKLSLAASLIVAGLHLAYANNVVRTLVYILGTFGLGTILSWSVEMLFASTLERVSLERSTAGKLDYQPVGGAAFESARPLLGGPHAPEVVPASFYTGRGMGAKGRSLDLTLPEERAVAPAPRPAPTAPDPLAAVRAAAAAATTEAHQPGAAGTTPQLAAPEPEFQDLSSLLRGSATPAAAVPAAARPAGQ